MAHRTGQAREQTTLFPVMVDDLVGTHSLVRVIDAWVGQLPMNKLGFTKAQAQRRGAPPYDPADLLKLYIWGYSHGSRSSRMLERECQTNVECMWLLRRLAPDHKTIANFRSENSSALVATCAAFVEFASQHRLITSKTIAIDGTKLRAVASRKSVLHKDRLENQAQRNAQDIARYLELLNEQDLSDPSGEVNPVDVHTALGELKARGEEIEQRIKALTQMGRSSLVEGEPQAQPMHGLHGAPGYNLQTAVEADSHLIVHHEVCTERNDVRQLQPMAEAAAVVVRKAAAIDGDESDGGKVMAVADSGYDDGAQIAALGNQQIITFVAPKRGLNPHGLLEKGAFTFDAEKNQYICPAGKVLKCKRRCTETNPTAKYSAKPRDCAGCALKPQCTTSDRRSVTRHAHQDAAQGNVMRVQEHPEMMDLRRQVVEHPFGTLKHVILGNARLLLRGLQGAKGELSLAVLVYNLKRVFSMKGAAWMTQAARG